MNVSTNHARTMEHALTLLVISLVTAQEDLKEDFVRSTQMNV